MRRRPARINLDKPKSTIKRRNYITGEELSCCTDGKKSDIEERTGRKNRKILRMGELNRAVREEIGSAILGIGGGDGRLLGMSRGEPQRPHAPTNHPSATDRETTDA